MTDNHSSASILHLSDIHFGAHDPALVRPLSEAIEEIGPDLIALTGDVTQRGKRSEFAAARDFVCQLSAPVVLTPGNHDTPLLNLLARGTRPFARHDRYLRACSRAGLETETLDVVSINTARGLQARTDWSLGVVNLTELDKATAHWTTPAPGKLRLLLCHHPLVTPAGLKPDARTRRGAAAMTVLSERRVDAVLSGHVHAAFVEPFDIGDGYSYAIGADTGLSTRTRGHQPGFNVIEADAERLTVRVFRWQNGFTETRVIEQPRRPRP